MAFALTAIGAALACALELFEAMAIVLAVALTRRTREALLGAGAAVLSCVALGVVLGPLLIARVSVAPLRTIVGVALLLFGLEWLRKAILRLGGRRARSSSYAEFEEEREALAGDPPLPDGLDWAGAVIAFKGVLLEGVEVILIVTALAARPGGRTPALLGAAVAALLTVALGALLHRPLRRVPETELKYVVGLVLTSFGTFFCAEGLGVQWPLGDAALLVLLALWLAASGSRTRGVPPLRPPRLGPRRAADIRRVTVARRGRSDGDGDGDGDGWSAMSALRAVRKLVLGETWTLPVGIALAVAVAGLLRLLVGPHGWWRDAGGAVLALVLIGVLAASLRPGAP